MVVVRDGGVRGKEELDVDVPVVTRVQCADERSMSSRVEVGAPPPPG
jgi:hypothetical protein